ncbi:phosphotransferase enzyme family protein [Mucilaginibacter sp. L3T2-6]|uniref:phosphotransferase enzyme family protein n=1 Tax=Mucilaginibacter sp. L3T2-6 TaxID=3062491 RepID=UPI002674FB7F|nr:aminoglycoside phosphotransferase family protein [Mucilaginibacter sp. L3T2-6]MDO3644733.1 aminoglycoside phosphotransferase family protein [Mucilaginibacter sp. L3T2-6]MDV6217231.1 aminoglycoside phosphotransferase family protein [Mucilaginibacter sp. L3T2-6]
MLHTILKAYSLKPENFKIESFGSGLINHTWKATGPENSYIIQRINKQVFKEPEIIANNLQKLDEYIKATAAGYLFAAPLPAEDGSFLVRIDGDYYRLFPFIKNSHTVDFLSAPEQAYEAAKQFGRFTRLLGNFNLSGLGYPLRDFHNLELRLKQFNDALTHAGADRKKNAAAEIAHIQQLSDISLTYEKIVRDASIPLRVIHHDTKINNILFDEDEKGLCVIDLDTVMPGYFISDVGDMMRTYLAEANEEEKDLDKIIIRDDFFAAIYAGYMEEMGSVLSSREKELFIYAGKFMIYMQAVRFLADYLNGDIYYTTNYPEHNLVRARNQLRLLEHYLAHEAAFKSMIAQFQKQVAGQN